MFTSPSQTQQKRWNLAPQSEFPLSLLSQHAPSVSGALAAGGGCGRVPLKRVKPAVRQSIPCPADSSFNTGLRRPASEKTATSGFAPNPRPSLQPTVTSPRSSRGPLGAREPRYSRSWWRVKACHRSSPGTARTHPGRHSPPRVEQELVVAAITPESTSDKAFGSVPGTNASDLRGPETWRNSTWN